MNIGLKRFLAVPATVAATAASLLLTPHAASAATGTYTKYRGDCAYDYSSSSTFAWSRKTVGSCSGHAWVRVMDKQNSLWDWRHHATFTSYQPSSGVKWSEHKSQTNETPWHHAP